MGLSAILYVVDSLGNRVDVALKAAGGFLPTRLKLGPGIAASCRRDGPEVEIELTVDADAVVTFDAVQTALGAATGDVDFNGQAIVNAVLPGGFYVTGTAASSTNNAIVLVWINTIGGDVDFATLAFQPNNNITQSDTDYWTLAFALSSDPSTPIAYLTTKVTGGVLLATGIPVTIPGGVTVPDSEAIVATITKSGSPTQLGGMFQGRAV